jgi:hypothetical protein
MFETDRYTRRVTLSLDEQLWQRLLADADAARRSPKEQAIVLLECALGMRRREDRRATATAT